MGTLNDTTRDALEHLRIVGVAGRWVTPTDDDMYFTLSHPLLLDEDYGSVEYNLAEGWVATVWLPTGVQKFPHLADSTWAKIKVEQVLIENDVLVLFPTTP